MAAVVQFYQTYGTAPGTDVPQGTGGANDWDFKNAGTPGPAIAGEEITAGNFSYHVYTKAKFTGSFSSITNVKYYVSTLNLSGCGTNAYILAASVSSASYSQPNTNSMSGIWQLVPTSSAGGVDIGTAALSGGTPGFTSYVALQLKTAASGASTGYSSYTTFTLTYDEV